MAARDVAGVAEVFWHGAGGRALFGSPVNITRAATRVLPVAIRDIPGLRTDHVAALLERIGGTPWNDGSPRRLRGCIVADAGKALVLVDGSDPDDERRMTVAHEVAHLILHYIQPRETAVRAFGPHILAVMDRLRPPTLGERFSSVLRAVPIEPFRHAMDRAPATQHEDLKEFEEDADDLAVELLAPWSELHAMHGASPSCLRERYGLPAGVAARLAGMIAPRQSSSGVLGMFVKK